MIPQSKSSPVKLKKADRAVLGQQLVDRIRRARSGMRGLLDNVKTWRAFYESDLPPKNFPWENCSNVNVPVTQWHVDTYQSHVADVVFGAPPYTTILALPGSGDNARESASRVENFLQNVEANLMRMQETGKPILHSTMLEGTCIVKLAWREDYRAVKVLQEDYDEETGEPIYELIDQDIPRYVGPKPELVDLANFVIYPLTVRSIDDAVLVGDRYRLLPEQVRERIDRKHFDRDYAKPLLESTDNELGTAEDLEDERRNDVIGIERLDQEYLWFWEVIYRHEGRDVVVTVESQTGTIVRIVEFPYWHGRRYYIPSRPFTRADSIFGQSIPGKVEHMQREINTIHNARSDAYAQVLAKGWKVLDTSELASNTDRLQRSPGVTIKVGSMDEIEEWDVNPIVPALDVEQIDRDYAERATAVTDITTGRETQGEKTAREVAIISSEGTKRFGDVVENVQMAMVEIGIQVLWLCYQFMSDEDLALYSGGMQGGKPIVREQLIMPYQFIAHGRASTANQVQEREEAVFLYDRLIANPLAGNNPLHIYRLTKDLLLAFNRDDYESFIGSEEQIKQQMQQMLMAQQAAQQAIQGANSNVQNQFGGPLGPLAAGPIGMAGGPGGPQAPAATMSY